MFKNKEESWLAFNERVLQEADDKTVPLIERLRFLGIYSNNRDEFFRVRIANLRRLSNLKKKDLKTLHSKPEETLKKLQKIVLKQESKFQKTYAKIIKELKEHNIYFLDERSIKDEHKAYLNELFIEKIRPALAPIMLNEINDFPWLEDRISYLAFKLINKKAQHKYALIEVPTKELGRFFELPSIDDKKYIILLDDVIRYFASTIFQIFDFVSFHAYSIKVTRDAELDLDDDISVSIVEKLTKSIKDRSVGEPVRFVHDKEIPQDLLIYILKQIEFDKLSHLIPSGKYHNYRDFMSFPALGKKSLIHKKTKHVKHKYIHGTSSYLKTIEQKDILLYYPYHDFNYLIDTLREAAIDPKVSAIKINLYRVASDSKVIKALINAVRNGKDVLAVVELKARFDEKANIHWSKVLQDEGVRVIFGVQGLKVHSKLILIQRKSANIAHIGTGNFHEKTANIYTDISLLTADRQITTEVERVFDFFEHPYKVKRFKHLFISPFTTRRRFVELIETEIKNAQKGKQAYIYLKINNLVDKEMIAKLYEAAEFGVHLHLIVRGMCAMVSNYKKAEGRIHITSIVDEFLEHTRLVIFCHGSEDKTFISSADWMFRNLDNRVEITAPIYDSKIKKLLKKITLIQLQDNVKARIVNGNFENKYVKNKLKKVRSQKEVYKYLLEDSKS